MLLSQHPSGPLVAWYRCRVKGTSLTKRKEVGMPSPARIFISYTPADENNFRRLEVHLAPLRREGLIAPWHSGMIEPGATTIVDIERNLTEADVILLLVSADFMATDDLFENELERALEHHEAGTAHVIPIIVGPVDIQRSLLAGLQPLPHGGTPVSMWARPEEAWLDVARGIRRVLETIAARLAASPSVPSADADVLATMSGAFANPSVPIGRAIKILFLTIEPTDAARNQLGDEFRAIDQVLRESDAGHTFELVMESAVRLTDLKAILLRHRPHIVHFSRHGSKSPQLVFENDQGTAVMGLVLALGQLSAIHGDGIRCVVLNACYAESQAESICQHVDCVVSMKGSGGNMTSISFSQAFYLALGHGLSVKQAFDAGCLQITFAGSPDTEIPILLKRPGADPSTVCFAYGEAGSPPSHLAASTATPLSAPKPRGRSQNVITALLVAVVLTGMAAITTRLLRGSQSGITQPSTSALSRHTEAAIPPTPITADGKPPPSAMTRLPAVLLESSPESTHLKAATSSPSSIRRPVASLPPVSAYRQNSHVKTGDLKAGTSSSLRAGNRRGSGATDVTTGNIQVGGHSRLEVGNVDQSEGKASVHIKTEGLQAGDNATIEIGNVR